MKTLNWTPAFAGETNMRKALFFVVIPGGSRNPAESKDEIDVWIIIAPLVNPNSENESPETRDETIFS